MGVDIELLCESLDGVEREITLSTLDPRKIAGGHVELLGEGFLREVATMALGT